MPGARRDGWARSFLILDATPSSIGTFSSLLSAPLNAPGSSYCWWCLSWLEISPFLSCQGEELVANFEKDSMRGLIKEVAAARPGCTVAFLGVGLKAYIQKRERMVFKQVILSAYSGGGGWV